LAIPAQIEELRSELATVREAVAFQSALGDGDAQNRAFLERGMARIGSVVESCARKSDLYELMQCFIASGSDGVFEFAARRKPAIGKTASESKPLLFEPELARRQSAAKVTLISGEGVSKSPRPLVRSMRPTSKAHY
jgi:hypothetical protein